MCQAPNTSRERVALPWPHISLPYAFGYVTTKDSHAICESAVRSFAQSNASACQQLRRSLGKLEAYNVDIKNTVISYGACLCTNPEAQVDNEDCHATTFCRVISNYNECPMSVLQQYLDYIRFRFHCIEAGQRAFLYGEQPGTIARCLKSSEKDREDKVRALAEASRNMEVYVADGGLYMLKKAPWVPKTSCVDAARSKTGSSGPPL